MSNNLTSFIATVIGAGLLAAGILAIQSHTPATPASNTGAVASPDIQSPYFSVGGGREWRQRTDALNQGTTTVCAIQAPMSTSTLTFGSIRFGVGSTTASTVTLSKASTPYATTTSLISGGVALAANAQGTIQIATTTPGLDSVSTFSPGQWFVVGMAGGTGTFSPTGTCIADWMED